VSVGGWPATWLRRLTAHAPPYRRIADFLPPPSADRLLAELIHRQDEFRARGRSPAGEPRFYRMLTPLEPPSEFARRFEQMAPLLERQFGASLVGARIELRGQAYGDGCSFGKHSDADAGGPNWQRRLSGIYYLHTRPRRFTGGALVLFDRRGGMYPVEPDHNSAVFFPGSLVHEVLPVSCASPAFADCRFALNVWIS